MIFKLWVLATIVAVAAGITIDREREKEKIGEQVGDIIKEKIDGKYIPVVLMHGVAQGNYAMDIVVEWLNGKFKYNYFYYYYNYKF